MKVAIISTDEDSSPKVLRQSLGFMMKKEGVEVVDIRDSGFLTRLFPLFGPGRKPGALHFRLRRKVRNYLTDSAQRRQLQGVDAIVFSVQCPNGFWRYEYAIEALKELTRLPIVYHEVYYLGNAPSQQARLAQNSDFGIERYDWHLAVTPVTEVYSKARPPWSVVGLNLEHANLKLPDRKRMRAIVDYPQHGHERQREDILAALRNLDFDYVELSGKMEMKDIRQLYRESALLFLSFPEAFGVPIAECLSCGTAVFMPDASWGMSWRLKEGTLESAGNKLPEECFWIYRDREGLEQMLTQFRLLPKRYARDVRSRFLKHYPYFYFGNQAGVKEFLSRLERRSFD